MNSDELKKSEFEIIDKILNDSRDRFSVLIDRYAPVVFHVVRRFERDEDEFDDYLV